MSVGENRSGAVARLSRRWADEIRKKIACRCLEMEPMAKHTSWRVGGPAAMYVYPNNEDAVCGLLQSCTERSIPLFVIGYGTNLLVSDNGYAGCIIDLANACRNLKLEGDELAVGAGAWLHDVVKATAENGLSGMEKLAGIPGGLGGGLSMNCGAFGGAISDHLVSLHVAESNGARQKMTRNEVDFQYRRAPGLEGRIVLSAQFKMPTAPREEVLDAVEATIRERFRRNVMTLPSAGSVFKNPPGKFSAKLIESVGGKGMAVGGAEVSQLHANFIVNARGGTAADIAALIRKVRETVFQTHQIELELEVRTLGFADAKELV